MPKETVQPAIDAVAPPTPEQTLYADLKAATLALRDAELALLAVQDRQQKAYQAWIKHVAPVGQQASPMTRGG
jgi:pyocin large subunit-like protein